MEDLEAVATQILKEDAARLGMSYLDYCEQKGIVGPSQGRQIRRHEVPLSGALGE